MKEWPRAGHNRARNLCMQMSVIVQHRWTVRIEYGDLDEVCASIVLLISIVAGAYDGSVERRARAVSTGSARPESLIHLRASDS